MQRNLQMVFENHGGTSMMNNHFNNLELLARYEKNLALRVSERVVLHLNDRPVG